MISDSFAIQRRSLFSEKFDGPRIANGAMRVVQTCAIFARSLVILGPPGFSLSNVTHCETRQITGTLNFSHFCNVATSAFHISLR
jgi:hypothetical protein